MAESVAFPVFSSESIPAGMEMPANVPPENVQEWQNAERVRDCLHRMWGAGQHRAQVIMHQLSTLPSTGPVNIEEYPALAGSGFLQPPEEGGNASEWNTAVPNLRSIARDVIDVKHVQMEGFRLNAPEDIRIALESRLIYSVLRSKK